MLLARGAAFAPYISDRQFRLKILSGMVPLSWLSLKSLNQIPTKSDHLADALDEDTDEGCASQVSYPGQVADFLWNGPSELVSTQAPGDRFGQNM